MKTCRRAGGMKYCEREGDMKMKPRHWFVLLVVIAVASVPAHAMTVGDATRAMADLLTEGQLLEGTWLDGSWRHEYVYTGSIVTGLVSAARQTGMTGASSDYLASARGGGLFIFNSAGGAYFGEEVLALTELKEISGFPLGIDPVPGFFAQVKANGTKKFIKDFVDPEPSSLVHALANYVIAAWETDAADKSIWRQALIDSLAKVDDGNGAIPVMALGAATWGLGKIGSLDDSLVDSAGKGKAMWLDITAADLPYLLIDHQVPQGEFDSGTFYWRFDHGSGETDNVPAGYVEDAMFSSLGLLAHHDALLADPNHDPAELALFSGALLDATKAILSSLNAGGTVHEHLNLGGLSLNAYAGEMLYLLDELNLRPDLEIGDLDNETDFAAMRRSP